MVGIVMNLAEGSQGQPTRLLLAVFLMIIKVLWRFSCKSPSTSRDYFAGVLQPYRPCRFSSVEIENFVECGG